MQDHHSRAQPRDGRIQVFTGQHYLKASISDARRSTLIHVYGNHAIITYYISHLSGPASRIGTLLEMVREIATALAADGKRVKVSVQQAMGAGVFQVIY